jgi:hypothetical protein
MSSIAVQFSADVDVYVNVVRCSPSRVLLIYNLENKMTREVR